MFPGEDRVLIESPKVPTYDLKPEMSAYGDRQGLRAYKKPEIRRGYLNYANCDMVHTGVFGARKAVETVDEYVGARRGATSGIGGITIVTADHGNADRMVSDEGGRYRSYREPGAVRDCRGKRCLNGDCRCGADIDLGINPPPEMDGKSLLFVKKLI